MKRTALLATFLVAPSTAGAQMAERVRDVDDGAVRFSYETKPGVEICDQGIRIGDRHMSWRSYGRDDRARNCRFGVAEVELEVRGGVVRNVEVVRQLDDWRPDVIELGEVAAADAADFLLSLGRSGATADAAEEAIFPAMLADVDDAWRGLLDLAKDRSLGEGVRKTTLFWLGQEAADAATGGLAEVALDEAEDQEIRNTAIFALSQRPDDEAIPVLMEVARTGEHAETRRTAMFWLAQSPEERVVRFFEDILLRRLR
jgi:hypothetical protein